MKYLLAIVAFLTSVSIPQASAFQLKHERLGLDLNTEKVSQIEDAIDMDTVAAFFNSVDMTQNLKGDRILLINSPGGIVDAGDIIIAKMNQERKVYGIKYICIAGEAAHSMAFNILTACDIRLASTNTKMVAHKIRIMFPPFVVMTAKMLRELADHMDKVDEPYRQSNAAAMHLSVEDYDRDWETLFLSYEQPF